MFCGEIFTRTSMSLNQIPVQSECILTDVDAELDAALLWRPAEDSKVTFELYDPSFVI